MRRYPFPIPFGWFHIAFPEELPAGEPKPLYYFDRHLVAWRDEEGAAHVNDAFCPHLGAHLGHGGTVEGCEIVCPFHGWRFDADGSNTDIPYSDKINRKARIGSYPVAERNGMVMAWYHPHGEAPMWEVPEVPEFSGESEFSTVIRTSYRIEAAWQEMAENAVDSAHFRFVHNTASVPEIEAYTSDGFESDMKSSQKFPTPRGVMEGHIDSHAWGPGLSLVWFTGIIDTVNLATTTPIDHERCEVRFNFRFRTMGDEKTTQNVGKAFVAEVDKQVREDMPIWEHKAHLVRPALADNDGPFIKFRKWAAQFYAEPVGDERTVYPPPPHLAEAPVVAGGTSLANPAGEA
jgi:phenylpropionate dioxygenase-like ring-hydroxylating dioxygenase large terminal subunit